MDMTILTLSPRLTGLLVMIGCCLSLASCAFMEKQMDQTVGGPNPPAETTVTMEPDVKEETPAEITAVTILPAGPLKITTTEAILLSLENNRSLVVERLNPAITKTLEDTERAVFDPKVAADIIGGRTDGERQARAGSETEDFVKDEGVGVISLSNSSPRAPPSEWKEKRT